MAKKIWLIIILAVIVGTIWYIESTKVHPVTGGTAGTPQTISLPASSTAANESLAAIAAADKAAGYQPAIEIADPTGFINASSTFRLSDLIGKKIVLLDFWTYSCINCIRTLPYLTSWYERYKDQGLVVVGIHTPEFDFEKNIGNVQTAVQQYGIRYPVVLDSDYGTWTAYGNLYWPHEYLIDIAGYIVHDQIGEGNYGETENEIQKLIAARNQVLGLQAAPMPTSTVFVPQSVVVGGPISPETYFGAARNEFLVNGSPSTPGVQVLSEPQNVALNQLYLVGNWDFEDQYATNNEGDAKIIYKYDAAKVFFVASGTASGTIVQVIQDGQPVSAAAGSDVHNGEMTVTGSRLYNVINNPTGSGEHTLEIIVDSPGLQAFTFTFG